MSAFGLVNVSAESSAILRLFAWMGLPLTVLGSAGLLVPPFLRDHCYRAFARNRGTIWTWVKRAMGWGDTLLEEYRGRILGLEDPLPESWGFARGAPI